MPEMAARPAGHPERFFERFAVPQGAARVVVGQLQTRDGSRGGLREEWWSGSTGECPLDGLLFETAHRARGAPGAYARTGLNNGGYWFGDAFVVESIGTESYFDYFKRRLKASCASMYAYSFGGRAWLKPRAAYFDTSNTRLLLLH